MFVVKYSYSVKMQKTRKENSLNPLLKINYCLHPFAFVFPCVYKNTNFKRHHNASIVFSLMHLSCNGCIMTFYHHQSSTNGFLPSFQCLWYIDLCLFSLLGPQGNCQETGRLRNNYFSHFCPHKQCYNKALSSMYLCVRIKILL